MTGQDRTQARRTVLRGGRLRFLRRNTLTLASALLVLLGSAQGARAQIFEQRAIDQKMLRFEFDNDVFLDSDDAFSAGWSLQLHSGLLDAWPEHLAPLGKVPGLGDDGEGGRIVRWAYGVTQMIVTPKDIEEPGPQPNDSPWAGILGFYGSFSASDNRRLVAVQTYLGCMGPCSQADEVQSFVHEDLGISESPAGWDNQLDTEVLGNLHLAGRYKLWAPPAARYATPKWASDFSVGAETAVGNLATFALAQAELRFGWGLPMGFTHIPDPPGVGIALDPLYVDRGTRGKVMTRWRGYASVVVRATAWDRLAPAEGGRTSNGGYHPGIDASDLERPLALLGLHVGRYPVAFHATYYRTIGGRQRFGQSSNTDWVNLSFEIRF